MNPEIINRPFSHDRQTRYYLVALSFVAALFLGLADHFISYWDTVVKTALFLIVIYLALRIKSMNEHVEEMVRNKTSSLAEEISELHTTLDKVKALSGFYRLCASCKKVRDEEGYWNQLEVYISERSEAKFTHGICPDCVKKLYPEFYDKVCGSHTDDLAHIKS